MSKHQYAALQKAVEHIDALDGAVGTLLLTKGGVRIEFAHKSASFADSSYKVWAMATWDQIKDCNDDFLTECVDAMYVRALESFQDPIKAWESRAKEMQGAA